MEYYKSTCGCGHSWFWTGRKTGIGMTLDEWTVYMNTKNTCPRCGGLAYRELDNETPEAKEYNEVLGGVLGEVLNDVLSKKQSGSD